MVLSLDNKSGNTIYSFIKFPSSFFPPHYLLGEWSEPELASGLESRRKVQVLSDLGIYKTTSTCLHVPSYTVVSLLSPVLLLLPAKPSDALDDLSETLGKT